MFRWLLSWFQRKPEFSLDLYVPAERFIYKYFDGKKVVTADPMAVCKRLAEKGSFLAMDMKVAKAGMKDSPKKHDAAMVAIRYVFGVPEFKDGGLTDLELVSLLEHYLTYEDYQKKTANLLWTLPTGTSSASPPSTDASPATPSFSGSGSTAAESSTEKPTPSISESGPPSDSSNPPTPTSPT